MHFLPNSFNCHLPLLPCLFIWGMMSVNTYCVKKYIVSFIFLVNRRRILRLVNPIKSFPLTGFVSNQGTEFR